MNKQKYTKSTKEYLDKIEQYLTKRYGKISPEWEGVIILLADNLDLYKECQSSIRRNGIYDASTGKKNPLLATCKDLQATIMKQIQHLGLSPYATAKISDKEEDDSDLLKNIMGDD